MPLERPSHPERHAVSPASPIYPTSRLTTSRRMRRQGRKRPHPGDEITGGGLIRPDQSEPGKPVPEDFQERLSAIAVLHVGGGGRDAQEHA